MAPGDAFAKRKKSLRKMARELSVLCGVDVALVVADDGAAGVWESREGVLARYRALPPEARTRHAHRAYLEAELGNKEAKLARVRQAGPGALRDDAALRLIDGGAGADTVEDARRLLDDLDAAIQAVDDRQAALGMPAGGGEDGDGVVLEGIAPLDSAAGVADGGCYLMCGGPGSNGGAGGQIIWGNDVGGGFDPSFTCGAPDMRPCGGYGFQFQFQEQCAACSMDGYHNLQMAPPVMYGESSSSDMSGYLADAYPYQLPDLAPMWNAAAETRHGMVPVEYTSAAGPGLSYYNYMVDTPAATSASLHGNGGSGMSFATDDSGDFVYGSPSALSLATGNTGGGNFFNAPPNVSTTGGAGDKFTYATAGSQAVSYDGGELTDAGWYDAAQWQQLHYLRDMEDTHLHLWGN